MLLHAFTIYRERTTRYNAYGKCALGSLHNLKLPHRAWVLIKYGRDVDKRNRSAVPELDTIGLPAGYRNDGKSSPACTFLRRYSAAIAYVVPNEGHGSIVEDRDNDATFFSRGKGLSRGVHDLDIRPFFVEVHRMMLAFETEPTAIPRCVVQEKLRMQLFLDERTLFETE